MVHNPTPIAARARNRDDDGFSLLELVVALAVMAIGVSAAVQVYFGALGVSSASLARAQTTGIGSGELERIRALPWSEVGFSSSAGAPLSVDGETTVIVPGVGLAVGQTATNLSGRDVLLERSVTWVDLVEGGQAKRVVVTATGPSTGSVEGAVVRHETLLYRGTGFETTASPAPPSGAPVRPGLLTITPDTFEPASALQLAWTNPGPPPQYWDIEVSTGGPISYVATRTLPGDQLSVTVRGIRSDATPLARVRGRNGTFVGAWRQQSAPVLANDLLLPCTGGVVVVSPTPIVLTAAGQASTTFGVDFGTSGTCPPLELLVPYDTGVVSRPMAIDGSGYSVNVPPASGTWNPGTQLLRIVDVGGNVYATTAIEVIG